MHLSMKTFTSFFSKGYFIVKMSERRLSKIGKCNKMIKTDGGTKELFDHKDALLSGQYLDLNLYGISESVLVSE